MKPLGPTSDVGWGWKLSKYACRGSRWHTCSKIQLLLPGEVSLQCVCLVLYILGSVFSGEYWIYLNQKHTQWRWWRHQSHHVEMCVDGRSIFRIKTKMLGQNAPLPTRKCHVFPVPDKPVSGGVFALWTITCVLSSTSGTSVGMLSFSPGSWRPIHI